MDIKTKLAIIIGIFIVLFIVTHKGWGPEVPYPGEAINATYPEVGFCDGIEVTFWGKPTYASDPNMQHMAGDNCIVENQCRTWYPTAYKGEKKDIYCCTNVGLCYTDGVIKNDKTNIT